MELRWGIAGAGRISHDFVSALTVLPKSNHQIIAVAARALSGAQHFATNHDISIALEGYDALAAHPDIDIVYVGTINPAHYHIAKLMLNHGKHVLCEKPLTMNNEQSKELINYAKERKLFLMEGIWSRCFPVYNELQKCIASGAIGDIHYVSVEFGFSLKDKERVNLKELGGSVILDIGIYALQAVQYVLRGLKPINLVGNGFLNNDGVDCVASCSIRYPNNIIASLSLSGVANLRNEVVIIGSKGIITIPEFWRPTSIRTPSGVTYFDLPEITDERFITNKVGLMYEADECRKCIKSGMLESSLITHEESIELAELMDEWRKSFNAYY